MIARNTLLQLQRIGSLVIFLLVFANYRVWAQQIATNSYKHVANRILARGQEIMRLKNIDTGEEVSNCIRYSLPEIVGVYRIEGKRSKCPKGRNLLLTAPIEFQVFKGGSTNQVAHGRFCVVENARLARQSAFGTITLNSSADLRTLARRRRVENIGDVIYCESVRMKRFPRQCFVIYRNVVIMLDGENNLRPIAMAILKASCPDADIDSVTLCDKTLK